jgi:hypothetical protein
MTENVAKCGLDCDKCRAYIATRTNDWTLADEIAVAWSNPEEGTYAANDIWCDGCHSDRLHGFCLRCPVRLCARERKLTNCGVCDEYPCGKLKVLWGSWVEASPAEASANLERGRVRTPPS